MVGGIDLARLESLEERFAPGDLGLLIEAFVDEAAQALFSLTTMMGDGPDPARERMLRYLAGAARNLGAVALAVRCDGLARSGERFGAGDLDTLSAEFRALRQWFDQRYRGAAAA